MQPANILVADDDAVARDLLAEALKKEGYAVEAFASGEEVIARGRLGRVDLVLTDIRMGAVDGLTVLREFKRMSPDTAVVVLTSFGSLEGAIEAIKQGAYDYLAKPFGVRELMARVRALLRRTGSRESPEGSPAPEPIVYRNIEIDPARRRVRVGARDVDLTILHDEPEFQALIKRAN